jgi:outer membrane protein assembly factor BamB
MDPATGQAIWKMPWTEGGWSSWNGNSSPSIVGDQMVINQKAGGMEGYPLSLDAPTKLWHLPDHDCGTSPLIYEGHVYTLGGGDYGKPTSIRCADLQTGKVNWEQPTQPQGCSSPIAADGKIFGYLKFGQLLCMWKADPDKYSLLATAVVKADGYSSLAFADGRLYLRLNDGVACYDVTRAANLGGIITGEHERKIFKDLPVGSSFYFVTDPNRRYEWLKLTATRGRNKANGNEADINGQTPVQQ